VPAGPTASLDVAHVHGLRDSNGLAPPVSVTVKFTPKANALYCCRYRVSVRSGEGFDIVVRGRGSYEEHEDKSRPRL
jgi:hypothetical protein